MHDLRFEDLIRQTLRDDAASLPFTITAVTLERRLAARRSRERSRSIRWLLVAAAVAALAGGAAIVGSRLILEQDPPPTPSVTLPAPADMLGGYADATLILEESVGPADAPLDPTSSAAPDASTAPVEIGRVKLTGPFVITVACLGSGQIRVDVRTASFDFPYTQAVAPCDGSTAVSEYPAAPIDPASEGDVISVIVDPGASWRVAVGAFPAELLTPPALAPIALTSGWSLVANGEPVLLSSASPRTGVGTATPADATRIGAFVECHGEGAITVAAGSSAATEIDCRTASGSRRLEYPVTGGAPVDLRVTGDGARLWVRVLVEADAGITTTYPTAPPLPDEVAAAPYVVPDASVVGMGTVGSNEQTVLEAEGGRPGRPSGDLLPVAFHSGSTGAHLELVSIASGDIERTLVEAPAPNFIFESWADSTHGAVFYGMATEAGVEFHRVGIDGADDQVIATVAPDPTGFTAELAIDHSAFVVDACHAGAGCARTIVDPATGASERTERAGDPVCTIYGIVDGTLVGTTRPVCTTESATNVVAIPLAGGEPAVVVGGFVGDEFAKAMLVATSEGPKLVLAGLVGPDVMPWDVIDIATLETAVLDGGDDDVPRSVATDVPLPGGWVMLNGGLGDFPWQRAFDRPVPIIVNLVTGERIELVNLPHWTGTLSVSP